MFSFLRRNKPAIKPPKGALSPHADSDYSTWEREGPTYEPVHRAPIATAPRYVHRDKDSFALEPQASKTEATIICVGDILCEQKLFNAHRNDDGRFDFESVYHFVRPLISNGDLAIANLETTVCQSSPYTGEQHKIDGKYHNNAPLEFLDAVRSAGFGFLMLANNHGLDSGIAGVVETLRHIDECGFMHTGL